jgi:hypothetical protein
MQRVTGSFNAATFEYVGLSGSAVSRGTIQAAWATGNSSSFTWTPYGCLDVGTVDLVMSTVLGGNSVQLRAFAPTYKNWIIKAWALYI